MKKSFKLDSHYIHWGITAFLVIVSCITFFLVLSEWSTATAVLQKIFSVLSPIIYGLMFAYLFNKLMVFLEKLFILRLVDSLYKNRPDSRKKQRTTRVISVTVTMLLALLFISGTLTLILPQLYTSLSTLVYAMPTHLNTVIVWLTEVLENNSLLESAAINLVGNINERFTSWIQTAVLAQANQIISNVVGGVIGVIRVVANLLIGMVISVYVMYHKERFSAQAKKLTYGIFKMKTANGIVSGARFLDKTCGSFITSRLIDALIVGIICYITLIILKMPYPMLVAAIVGITNIIPFFGPFIGGIPSAALILMVNPTQGLIFVIFIIILQQLDGNVLYPKIQGSSIGISGFWIIFSLLFFGGLFSFWGMLLGVPVFAVIYAMIKSISTARLRDRGLPVDTNEYNNILSFDSGTRLPIYKNARDSTAAQAENDGGDNNGEDTSKDN